MQFVYDVSTQYLRYNSLSIPSNSALSFSLHIFLLGTHISLTNPNVYTRHKTEVVTGFLSHNGDCICFSLKIIILFYAKKAGGRLGQKL